MSQATPPPFPPSPPVPAYPPMNPGPFGSYQRGPVGGPPCPYQPQSFPSLYLWWAILLGGGILLSVTVIGAVLGVPALIAALVLSCVLQYKFWNQIQDGYQRTSPGLAVGLSFVPVFHFYWVFVGIFGLSQDMNAYCRRYGIQTPPVNERLALAYAILCCCLIVPYLDVLVIIGVLVIQYILYQQFKVASMAIAHFKLAHAARLGLSPGFQSPPPVPAPMTDATVPLMAR